jgi:hypothetical protein
MLFDLGLFPSKRTEICYNFFYSFKNVLDSKP